MTSFGESLLKYDNPILVKTKGDKKSQKGRTLTLSNLPAPSFAAGVPSPPTQNLDENILHAILPPREWTEGDQQWVQKVSTAITTRKDVIHLQEQLNIKLKQKKAKPTGICPIRWVLFSQCFDELIRQVTIECAERGLLLCRVRNEMQMMIRAYQNLSESSIAFGMRKSLHGEQGKEETQKKILDLEAENKDLMKQLNELKDKCDMIENREAEEKQLKDKQHDEEIQRKERVIQQLKNQLEDVHSAINLQTKIPATS
ncbi:axonemal dynein light intermediate polypeptide 1 [Oryzias latipes]|uniref:axonemal dynein light intermediate polypeptide 1 n=1 Tax=Oryzias latipes TaxID=8090 RepID=UPI0002A4C037|nr:axonemal dynein light intermediate polypeptide 1 [Oryzias latipes]